MAKLMIVDDDPLVRSVIVDALSDAGHAVLEAASGPAAVALLERHPDCDLVLIDFLMPEMKGDEVARRASAMYPDLKVAFLTGYGEFLELTGRGEGIPLLTKGGGVRSLVVEVETLLRGAA